MDISDTVAPTSEQLDAIDLHLSGPRTFTVSGVRKGAADQPVQIDLAEFDRTWRPGKSMRRVLIAAWGADAGAYVGRRVTLYCDPKVKFGGAEVGGIRVSHLSHIDKPLSVPLIVTRGKSAIFKVQVLADDAPVTPTVDPTQAAVDAFARGDITQDQLEQHVDKPRAEWSTADVKTLTDLFADLRDKKITKDEVFGTPPPGGVNDPWAQDTLTSEAPA